MGRRSICGRTRAAFIAASRPSRNWPGSAVVARCDASPNRAERAQAGAPCRAAPGSGSQPAAPTWQHEAVGERPPPAGGGAHTWLAPRAGTRAGSPVWFMRQGGRSLPELPAACARQEHHDARPVSTPTLICEITLQPVRRRRRCDAADTSSPTSWCRCVRPGWTWTCVADVGPVDRRSRCAPPPTCGRCRRASSGRGGSRRGGAGRRGGGPAGRANSARCS